MNIILLRKRLPVFLLIPLSVLLIYLFYSAYQTLEQKIAYNTLYKYIDMITPASKLIHELQKERGYSDTYVVTNGNFFKNELYKQRKLTDISVKEFELFLTEYHCHNCGKSFKLKMNFLLKSLKSLKLKRESIDNFMLEEDVNYYTQIINSLIGLIKYILPNTQEDELLNLAQSYITIVEIQEKAGLERKLVSKIFAKGKISNKEFYTLGKIITSQEVYFQFFKTVALPKYLQLFKKKSKGFVLVQKERKKLYLKRQSNEILTSMKEYIGYGGLIYNFKNYAISGKEGYRLAVEENFRHLSNAISKYKSLSGITKKEKKELDIIRNTFVKYLNALKNITNFYATGGNKNVLDNVIKIDDRPALMALKHLSTNIYDSPTYWFNILTDRINILHELELNIAKDMNNFVKRESKILVLKLILKVILLGIVFIVIVSAFVMIRTLIVSSKMLNRAQENTRSGSYEYYVEEDLLLCSDEYYKLLELDKETFELDMKSFMNFIHTDDVKTVQDSLQKAITSKKIIFVEYRVILKNDKTFCMRSSLEGIKYDRAGNAKIIVGTMTDISEAKQLEQEIINTQKDVILTMGTVGEGRSKETGEHVKKVAEYSKLLALLYGESKEFAELLKMVSPMHDIGKVGIPDSILNKPSQLTPSERAIMQTHSEIGYNMLKNSKREVLKLAATVALTHHEFYDGNGYPKGLKKEEIPLVGRITALVDVFDALGSDRCYKKAWNLEDIILYIKQQKGLMFDPVLVKLFLENLDKFLLIRDKYEF